MVDMIEHINGSGLSGMAGKTGKHAKNSLFGKLLTMLEKHAQITAKGKITHAGKGGILRISPDKSEPLIAAKGKQLLSLAMKGKHGIDPHEEDKLTPVVAAHILIAAASLNKKTLHVARASLAGEQTHALGALANPAGTLSMQSGGVGIPVLIGQTAKTGQTAKAGQAIKVDQSVLSDVRPSAMQLSQAAGSRAAELASAKFAEGAVQISGESPKNTSEVKGSVSETAARTGVSASATRQQTTTDLFGQKAVSAEPGTEPIAGAADKLGSPAANQVHLQSKVAWQANTDAHQAKADTKLSHTESAKAPVAAHVQQNKITRLQQGQSVTTSQVATATGMAAPGLSVADSGSQSSDKGNQDGRYISALGSDAKSGSSAASSPSGFHQYLSGKTPPSMTLFDSIKHIVQSASKGKTRLEIQLEPANLGKIQISLQSDAAKHLQVHMIVDQSMTRTALEQQLPQLKSALAQQGFDLSGFSMGSQGQQPSFGGNHRRNQAAERFDGPVKGISETSIPATRRQGVATESGLSIRV